MCIIGCAALFAIAGVDSSVAAPTHTKRPTVRPAVLKGSGSRVLTVTLSRSGPMIVTASNTGESNFIVHMLGPSGEEFLFNEIGTYRGQTVVEDATAGRYKVEIQSDGRWALRLTQPTPSAHALSVPRKLRGRGARVIQIRATRSLQPTVTATHNGQANFIVHLIGFGNTSGSDYLFNEIGRYRGQTLISDMPKGNYLLYVQADGAWTVAFTP